ncbi:hypothetical protein [Sphingomonas bacterium]|uniref:hypothetical protein n=1 Tax=Sphingomonas bacterium TaxID=1895847 RepID=UPI001576118F|nr:hypothetical protein [Sphingomonas bacterium]
MSGPPRDRAPDPGLALLHALAASAPRGSAIELVDMTSTGWGSATFTGARHVIRLRGRDDPALASWLAGLLEAQFRLRGHLVADIALASVERCGGSAAVVVEALTLDEA